MVDSPFIVDEAKPTVKFDSFTETAGLLECVNVYTADGEIED